MRCLAGDHVFDAPDQAPGLHLRLGRELHNKRVMRGKRWSPRHIWLHLITSLALQSALAMRQGAVPTMITPHNAPLRAPHVTAQALVQNPPAHAPVEVNTRPPLSALLGRQGAGGPDALLRHVLRSRVKRDIGQLQNLALRSRTSIVASRTLSLTLTR
jgi:hypothetical protein